MQLSNTEIISPAEKLQQLVNTPHYIAREAVADAMFVAFADLFCLDNMDNLNRETDSLKRFLTKKSFWKCERASLYTLYYLFKTKPELFAKMLLLRGDSSRALPLKNDEWGFYVRFLLQDHQGNWYSGSPANYEKNAGGNPATEIIEGTTLPEIMDSIQQNDGGEWPAADEISHFLNLSSTYPSIAIESNSSQKFHFLNVVKTGLGNTHGIIEAVYCKNDPYQNFSRTGLSNPWEVLRLKKLLQIQEKVEENIEKINKIISLPADPVCE